MHKRVVFIVAMFFALFPLCVHAGETNCKYKYDDGKVSATIRLSYSLETNNIYKYSAKIVESSDLSIEMGTLNFNNADFENTTCPSAYITKYFKQFLMSGLQSGNSNGKLVKGELDNGSDIPSQSNDSDLTCRYFYNPNNSVEVTFDINYNSTKTTPDYKIFTDYSNYPSEIVDFALSKDDFVKDGKFFCPTIYMSYLVDNNTTELHIHNKYVQGLTGVNGKKIDPSSGNNGTKKTITTINPDPFDTNCADFADTLKIGGLIIFIIKVLLPLIIIVRASLDLFSVVTSGDSGEFGKKMKKLGVSLVSAILIFFVPTIVSAIFGIITDIRGVNSSTSDIEVCKACLFEPFSGQCVNNKENEKSE